jgi:hypothetical protein
MTEFAKGDLVRVLATKFDCDEKNADDLGLKYSERQLRDGKGAWCYGNTINGNAIWVRLNEMHVTNFSFSLPLFYHALHYLFCTICRTCIC